ncbi:MAG: DNA translocase FtsK 4TM domain-containing protein [Candidatus Aminicenantes bacterium]|nr:DNA translocase FtsK 4TM domain-containing protein [Candidatus Aminicenantes bacterium]
MTRKNKKRPQKQLRKKKQRKKVHAPEVIGIFALLLAVFLFLSLSSYHSHDPSWAAVSSGEQKVQNFGGRVGASLAEALLQLLGFVAFMVPLAIIYLAVQPFRHREEKRFFLKSASALILLLLLSSLLYLLLNSVTWREAKISSGGLVGALFASLFIRYFNHIGSIFIIIGALLLFVVFSTRLSLGKIAGFLSQIFRFAFKEMRIRITHFRKEKQKQKMRKQVIAKYAAAEPKEKKEKEVRILTKGKRKKSPEDIGEKLVPEAAVRPLEKEEFLFPELGKKGDYQFPPYNLLDPAEEAEKIDKKELFEKKEAIEQKLMEFRVQGEVREYHPGPIVTTYEYYPHAGIKVSQVANLSEELALALQAESVRIQRIPGKSSLGIEAPNNRREIIRARDIIQSEKFRNSPSKLTIALGKTIHGEVYVTDLAVMPHLLIGGATGTGKSVALNTIITSLMYKASPDEVKIILVDPKRLEFSLYDGMPHLMCPVVKDPRKAGSILIDAINKMDDRYHILGAQKVRNIEQYNLKVKKMLEERRGNLTPDEKEELKPLPYIVIIIDELAELMMIGAEEVEKSIARLAQLARAVGIHLVMATQRPSIDVITGTIKNNFSCRIAFRVPTKIDSRIIIDSPGAEKLLGKGDMLFMPPNYPRILRLHCSYISLAEVTRITKFVKDQAKPCYDEDIIKVLKSPEGHVEPASGEKDALFEKAAELVLLTGQASASYLQRKLKLGYARAARIIDQMEMEGIVGPSEGSKPREILIDPETYLNKISKF